MTDKINPSESTPEKNDRAFADTWVPGDRKRKASAEPITDKANGPANEVPLDIDATLVGGPVSEKKDDNIEPVDALKLPSVDPNDGVDFRRYIRSSTTLGPRK